MEEVGKLPRSGKLSHKVVAIAAGEAHTLALTGNGSVFSWGRGTFGRLGTGKEDDELFPVPVEFDLSSKTTISEGSSERKMPKFVEIAAGAYHSLALEDDGSVWCWGYNIYGQLGFGEENSLVPRFLERFLELGSPNKLPNESSENDKTPLKVSSVKAGGMMSFAIDNLGTLWMWGNCPPQSKNNNDEFSLVSSATPLPVWEFHGHTVVKVACGNEHIVALISAGETYTGGDLLCYSWGNNNHGQLGLGDKESRVRPEIVETFNRESLWEVYEVACGAFHSALLTRKKFEGDTLDSSQLGIRRSQEKESICWTFGLGDNGQLGHETTQSLLFPKPVKGLPQNVNLISLDCGLFHTCVVSAIGDVWSWGMEKGLGLCPDASFTGTDSGDALSPLKIQCNDLYEQKFARPVQVACGAAHTVLVAYEGYKIWSWGRGRSGVLGTGNTADSFDPSIAMWPPLDEDFGEKELETASREVKLEDRESGRVMEMEKRLSMAMEEVKLLHSKLSLMEQYAGMLHGSIFGEPFDKGNPSLSMLNSGTYDIAKEWEKILESADLGKLARLERFYRNMLAGVKDKVMKRKIQELVRECLLSSTTGNQDPR